MNGYPIIFQRANGHQGGVSKNFFLLECDTWRSTGMRKLRTAEDGRGPVQLQLFECVGR